MKAPQESRRIGNHPGCNGKTGKSDASSKREQFYFSAPSSNCLVQALFDGLFARPFPESHRQIRWLSQFYSGRPREANNGMGDDIHQPRP